MDIEKLKSICEESSQPIGNMDEFPLAKALHKSATFRSNVGPHHILELINEIQTLRAKVASAEIERLKAQNEKMLKALSNIISSPLTPIGIVVASKIGKLISEIRSAK